MHSAKNTVVAILLLGVSYGVYQVINAPPGGDPLAGLMQMSGAPAEQAAPLAAASDDDWNAGELPPPPSTFPPLTAGRTLDEPGTTDASPELAGIPALNPSPQPLAEPPSASSFPDLAQTPPAAAGTESPSALAPFVVPRDERLGQLPNPPSQPPTQFQPVAPTGPGTAPGAMVSVPAAGPAAPSTVSLDAAWPEAERQIATNNYRGALEVLTPWHERTVATDPSRDRLNQWLDALASKVVYSVEHHLDPVPYIVKSGDTLDSIAQAWSVPQQLVYNINQQKIPNPMALTAGTELKQVRGPFHAVVHAGQRELTLYVNGLYAGRFAMAAGAPAGLTTGNWQIADKKESGHSCGPWCLQLNQPGLALHAADATTITSGGIAFQTADAKDLFNILTVGSTVSVR